MVGVHGNGGRVSIEVVFCSIVVNEIANVMEMMPTERGRTTPLIRGNPIEMLLPASLERG